MSTVVCYKTVQPTIYNKGTKYASSCDEFLAYYTYKSVAEAQAEVDNMNATHPNKTVTGMPIDWATIDHFFVSRQAEMY